MYADIYLMHLIQRFYLERGPQKNTERCDQQGQSWCVSEDFMKRSQLRGLDLIPEYPQHILVTPLFDSPYKRGKIGHEYCSNNTDTGVLSFIDICVHTLG